MQAMFEPFTKVNPMTELIKMYEHQGLPVVTSRDVASTFNRRHADVLRSIKEIAAATADKEFTERNFALSSYTDSTGRKLPEVLLTKDGFTLLAMGFTTPDAMAYKVAYIKRFNAMEAKLVSGKGFLPVNKCYLIDRYLNDVLAGNSELKDAGIRVPKYEEVYGYRGRYVTNSVALANFLGKRHQTIRRSIDGWCAKYAKLGASREVTDYFVASKFTNKRGHVYPSYLITREGLYILALGYLKSGDLGTRLELLNNLEQLDCFLVANTQRAR